jgi:hypothetical protein
LNGTVHALRDDALANTSSLVEVGGGVPPPSTRRETSTLIALAYRLGVEVVCHVWAEVR